MAERDVEEQWAAIVAHWDDVALGLDPYGDPTRDIEDNEDTADAADAKGVADANGVDGHRAVDGVNPVIPGPRTEPVIVPSEVVEPSNLLDALDHLDAMDDPDTVRPDGSLTEDAHYVPPPPAPLPPSEDKHFWTMIAALVTGPLLFLYLLLFNRDGNGWWMMFALLVSIAGFVLLVLRQPLDRDEDDDGIRL